MRIRTHQSPVENQSVKKRNPTTICNVQQLHNAARQRSIKGRSTMNKAQLEQALQA